MSFDKGKQSSNQVNCNGSPIGRLKRAYDYWQSIKANDHVLKLNKFYGLQKFQDGDKLILSRM
jgi:hypothetical protein